MGGEHNNLSGKRKSRKSWTGTGTIGSLTRMGIRCCQDEWGLAWDETLLFWVTLSGDIPARRDVEHAQWRSLSHIIDMNTMYS